MKPTGNLGQNSLIRDFILRPRPPRFVTMLAGVKQVTPSTRLSREPVQGRPENQIPMRSTHDIIVALKQGQSVSEDEVRIALLVMATVDAFTWRELYELVELIELDKPGQTAAKAAFAKSILERMYQAKREAPEKWLEQVRSNERDRWAKISKKLLEEIEQGIGKPTIAENPKAALATPPAGELEAMEKATPKKRRGPKPT
jgi:hypothetical protein